MLCHESLLSPHNPRAEPEKTRKDTYIRICHATCPGPVRLQLHDVSLTDADRGDNAKTLSLYCMLLLELVIKAQQDQLPASRHRSHPGSFTVCALTLMCLGNASELSSMATNLPGRCRNGGH